jgi:hypothetical protein
MKKADEMIGKLVKFIEKIQNTLYGYFPAWGNRLWKQKEIYIDLFVTNAKKFMDNFDLGTGYYDLKPSMVPSSMYRYM